MSEIQITTSQNVSIGFPLGNLGHRLLAHIIDWLIKSTYSFIIGFFIIDVIDRFFSSGFTMIIIFLIFTPVFFYTLLSETFMNGQTLGKKVLALRVVKIDGYSAGFPQFFLRWCLNEVWLTLGISGIFYVFLRDVYFFEYAIFIPFSIFIAYILDFILLVALKKTQRVGDIVAGTTCVIINKRTKIEQTILVNLAEDYQACFPSVIKLTDNDMRIIKDSYIKSSRLGDYETIKKLRIKIVETIDADDPNLKDQEYVKTIIRDFNYYTQ